MLPGMQALRKQRTTVRRPMGGDTAVRAGRACTCTYSLGAPAQGGALVVGIVKVPLPGAPNSPQRVRP